jgi:hypothetical protein
MVQVALRPVPHPHQRAQLPQHRESFNRIRIAYQDQQPGRRHLRPVRLANDGMGAATRRPPLPAAPHLECASEGEERLVDVVPDLLADP